MKIRISRCRSQKEDKEAELNRKQNRHYRLKEKLDQLKSAFNRVVSDLARLESCAKKLGNTSKDTIGQNISAIDKCICLIEEYLATRV